MIFVISLNKQLYIIKNCKFKVNYILINSYFTVNKQCNGLQTISYYWKVDAKFYITDFKSFSMSGDGGHDLSSSKILAAALGITVANMVECLALCKYLSVCVSLSL